MESRNGSCWVRREIPIALEDRKGPNEGHGNTSCHEAETPSIERWKLPDYIEVAAELTLIGESTANLARLSKDFRNLIHPAEALDSVQSVIGEPHSVL
jgi:hypothetical protein